MKRLIAVLLILACLFSLSAGAFTLPEGMQQDLSGMGMIESDTFENGCVNLPITWTLNEID